MKKLITTLSAAALLAACGAPSLEGSWVQPVPGMEEQMQGMTLASDGTAASLNMSTLVYETWRVNGNTLTLSGESIGNGQTIAFTQNYTFSMPDNDTLVLTDESGAEFSFTRQK